MAQKSLERHQTLNIRQSLESRQVLLVLGSAESKRLRQAPLQSIRIVQVVSFESFPPFTPKKQPKARQEPIVRNPRPG
jgi:hypothetical protein